MRIGRDRLLGTLLLALLLACVTPSRGEAAKAFTPQEVVDIWSKGSASNKLMAEAFPEDMRALAAQWIARERAGASEAELHRLVRDGSDAIVTRNNHFLKQAPDTDLTAYAKAWVTSLEQVKAHNIRLCLGFDQASNKDFSFLMTLPMQSVSIVAMGAGRRSPLQRSAPSSTDQAAYQAALAAQLGPAEREAIQTRNSGPPTGAHCDLQAAVYKALLALDPETRGRVLASLIPGP